MVPAPKPRPSSEDRIKAALWFAEHGFGVFSVWSTDPDGTCRCPLRLDCTNAGKHPIPIKGFHDATLDADRIKTMLSAGSEPNYGLVCPDGVFALDVDGDGIARLIALELQYGELPPTLRTKTAHGEHVFLRWPAGLPRPLGQLWGFVTRWGAGAGAGYVIGPRSVHASGFAYDLGSSVVDIATLPDTWAQSIIAPPKSDVPEGEYAIPAGGYSLPEPGFSGSRYEEILRYIASRYMRGMSKEEIWAGVLTVLAPLFADTLDEPQLRDRFERAWKNTPARLGPVVDFDAEAQAAEQAAAAMPAKLVVAPWPAPPADEAYHGVLGDIVRAVTPVTEADPVAILGSLLAYAGACMGHGRSLYQGSTQTANLFITLVGDSSTGRKGTASSIARDVMDLAYPEWKTLIVAGLGSGEGLIGHLKKMEQAEGQEHRAIVTESEFGRLLTVMAREGSTLSPVVRDAWDGVPLGRFLAREQSLVMWHHVSISAHVTVIELRQKLTNTDAANGFANRFLWLAVRRTKLVPFPQSPKDLVRPYASDLRKAIDAAQTPGTLDWSPVAADRWEELYTASATRPRYGMLGALLARGEAQIARLALLYALLDRGSEVGAQHLAAAEALWAYVERSATHIFGQSTGDRHADALLTYLAEGPIEWMEARKALGLRYASEMDESVGLLVSLGLADVVTVKKEGRGRSMRVIRGRTASVE